MASLVCSKRLEFTPRLTADATAPAQQFPAHVFEFGGPGLTAQPAALGAAHLIERLVQMHRDVKAVENLQRLAGLGGDHPQIGLPHVAADEAQPPHHLRTQGRQAAAQRRLCPARSDPEQAAAVGVDLVDDGQEVLRTQPLAPMDFVDADRLDALQVAVRQAPLHEPVDRPIDGFPTGLEGLGGFAPRQAARPAGQKAHHRDGQRSLTVAPRKVLDGDAMLGTIHAAGGVAKPGANPPQGNEPPGSFGQVVIARGGPQALGALAGAGGVRFQLNLDAQRGALAEQTHLPVNEAFEVLNPVQDGLNLQLNSWSPRRVCVFIFTSQTKPTTGDQLFFLRLPRRHEFGHAAVAATEDRALRGRNPSAAARLQTAAALGGWLTPAAQPEPAAGAVQSEKSQGVRGQRPPNSPTNSAIEPFT